MINPYNNPNYLQDLMVKSISQPAITSPVHTVKVNGRAGAEAYNELPPNSDAILLDQNDPLIWFVQTDGAGYKTITPYDISIHKEVKAEDKFKSLEDRISKLEEAVRNGKSNFRPNEQRQHNNAGSGGNAQG